VEAYIIATAAVPAVQAPGPRRLSESDWAWTAAVPELQISCGTLSGAVDQLIPVGLVECVPARAASARGAGLHTFMQCEMAALIDRWRVQYDSAHL
jgi:hypothetical protein